MSQLEIEGLNKRQKDAVQITDGRLLILAGAGSGKTKVLTTKIAYLIEKKDIPPEAILGLTFTRKAAEEMRERLALLIDPKRAKKVMLSTFHSFSTFILRKDIHHLGYTSRFTLYDRQDMLRLANTIARDLLEHEGELPSIARTLECISNARNRALEPHEVSGTGSKWHDAFVQKLFTRLNQSMKAYNAVDFDHLLYLVYKLFKEFPEVLTKYQERFQYILIDEYQDTNPVQARIAESLCAKSSNLCVVGDDDQSIYGWRGADVNNILKFNHTKVITLDQNFRSTNSILKAANAVIHYNEKRHGKSLWSDKGEGDLIEVFYAPTEINEAEGIAKRLLHMKEKYKLRWQDFAVLYRSNTLSRAIESAFLKQTYQQGGQWMRGIPYRVFGGDEFYEHKEVKDLLAYLRVLANESDHEAFLRIINYPRRGIGEQTLSLLTTYHRTHGVSLWHIAEEISGHRSVSEGIQEEVIDHLTEKARAQISSFMKFLYAKKGELSIHPPSYVLENIVREIHFHKAINEEVKSEAMRKWKQENIQGLITTLQEFEKGNNEVSENRLADFLSTMMVEKEHGGWKKKEQNKDHVHVMTFHSAKGLEFATCFLIGLEDHLIPHEKSVLEGNLEEERRLMYVAMTRAKRFLTLSMSASRQRMNELIPTKPSRFLFEIPKEFLLMTKWDKG